jgi:methionine-rich copper-binding protein CopC
MSARRLTLALTLLALLLPVGAAQAATIWTPVSSGTTDTISSIVYQSPTRFWYATTNGKIEYFNGSSFVAGAGISPGENFTDLAFQPTSVAGGPGTSGLYGYAVASSGDVWQTSNGGVSWTPVPPPQTPADCLVGSTVSAETELNAVVWSSSSTVYLLGNNSTLAKSTAGNSPTPAFAEINKNGSGTCAAQNETTATNLTDATFLPANPLDGFIVSQDFGVLYSTSNAFTSGTKESDTVNDFTGNPRIAQDAANPNRLWIVDHEPGGAGCGSLCLELTTDGGVTHAAATFPNDTDPQVGLYDVSSHGATEVAAGSGGEIFNSVDGSKFYLQRADGALATENWRAEDAYDAQHAAVGGEGGALVVTAEASAIHQPPPSGSHPTTTTTAGVSITIFKIVFVTGRSARYAPINVTASAGRKVVATILTVKGKHKLATGSFTLKRRGHGVIHVKLPTKVKPGTYYVVVRVATLKGHHVGRTLILKFKLV